MESEENSDMEETKKDRTYPINSIRVCVDSAAADEFQGRFYSRMNPDPIGFHDIGELIVLADKLFDKRGYPQTFQERRSFRGTAAGAGHYAAPEIFLTDEEIEAQSGAHGTFDILVESRRRAGWQGMLLGGDGSRHEYQSEMELLKEIDAELRRKGR